MPDKDPWADDPTLKGQRTTAPAENADDWKVWQQNDSAPTSSGGLSMAQDIGDFATGVGKGAASTLNNIGHVLYPDWLAKHITGAPSAEQQESYFKPKNTAESIGKGAEQIGEFMVPGGAEEDAARAITKMAPKVGELIPKLATSAATSGAINAAQGGSPVTGALMGAGGRVIGEGLKAMAPTIAEGALNIRKLDRAYGKGGGNIGRAILNETKGIRPGTIAESAEQRLSELNPQLEAAADRASVRPNPVRGMLPAPAEEIPLAAKTRNPKMRPMAFDAQVNPEEPMEPRSGNPMAPISEYPGINPHYLSGSEHPELSGRYPTMQGVLIRPQEVPIGAPPLPRTIPSRIASLGPARGEISKAFGTALRQGERTTTNQLQPMATHLSETMTGQPIPQNVTPRELLDLKRGFGNEFIHRWNPDTMTGVKGTAGRTYHQMAQEFNRVVPEAEGLNTRISNLIPVAKRASSAELNAPTMQRAVGRFAAHTGALTGAGIGGTMGYKEGGVPGAVIGGIGGVLAPELIASPEGEMATARLLNKVRGLKPLVGIGAQATRGQ